MYACCLFYTGNYLVKYFLNTKVQEFAPCSETSLGVTATVCINVTSVDYRWSPMPIPNVQALSMTRRYIAVTERNETPDGASICVFNVRTMSKRRTMVAGMHLVPALCDAISLL